MRRKGKGMSGKKGVGDKQPQKEGTRTWETLVTVKERTAGGTLETGNTRPTGKAGGRTQRYTPTPQQLTQEFRKSDRFSTLDFKRNAEAPRT